MYIEQAKKRINYPILALLLPLGFGLFIYVNYLFTKGVDTAKMIQETIANFGVNGTFLMIIMPLVIGFFVVLFWVKFIQNQSLTSLTTAREKIDWNRIVFSFLLWATVSGGMILLAYFLSPEDFIWNFKPKKFVIFFIMAILLIPLQTSFEEYLFRGQMAQGLGILTKSKLMAWLVPSFLFGIMHIANPEVEKIGMIIMVYYIGTGLFLGFITMMDDGLELALGFHAANNLVSALLVTSDWTAFQTHSLFKSIAEPSNQLDIFIPVLVLFPILSYIFAKKYKWNHYKERLTGSIVE